MTLLIVDDEFFAIQGIRDSVNWNALPFDKILDAQDSQTAMEIFQRERVDVLLCDIEMPGLSGLDLVEWVQENFPETISIFLTCHGEFDFARQAIKLQAMEYCLKPIAPEVLRELLLHAATETKRRKEARLLQDYGRGYVDSMTGEAQEGSADAVAATEVYIRQNISTQFTVEELAKRVFVSPDHLNRAFKKRYGKTLTDYVTDLRMFLAQEMIEGGKASLSAVSLAVGYTDYAYFSRTFKRAFGKTPKEYRDNFHS